MDYLVKFFWDNEAAVWVATSNELPGLVLESGSFDALVEKVKFAVPELLEANNVKIPYCNLNFVSDRHEKIFL